MGGRRTVSGLQAQFPEKSGLRVFAESLPIEEPCRSFDFRQLFTMKVISFRNSLPVTPPESFLDLTADQPVPGPRDLLVEVRAISVNPVDAKIRAGGGPGKPQ